MSSPRGLPYVRAGAVVSGISAVLLARLLVDVEERLDVMGIPEAARDGLRATVTAIEQAAEVAVIDHAARAEHLRIAEVGSAATGGPAIGPDSGHELVTIDEAAAVLGVKPRQMRNLAAAGWGRKVAGRWLLDRAAVTMLLAERRRAA